MTESSVVTLDIQKDFAEKLTASRPVAAIAELIWNGLDAEANTVKVTAEVDDLRLRSITIRDDGHGMRHSEAARLFGNLGGSWKKSQGYSRNGKRRLHGKEGRGRLRALSLGRVAEWTITSDTEDGELETFTVLLIRDNLTNATITAPTTPPFGERRGVTVRISEPDKDWRLDTPEISQDFAELFALYLTEHSGISLSVDGKTIKPEDAMTRREKLELMPIIFDGQSYQASLEIIEWKRVTERMLYLCDEWGLPLHRVPPTIHAPGFEFSAYLRSKYNSILNQRGTLELGEMEPQLLASIEGAKEKLRLHFRDREAEDTRSLVERWKEDETYPYEGAASSPVQEAERQVFDIVALNVAKALPDFESLDRRNRKWQLRMLRQALETGPEEVQLIMAEVLGLSRQKQEELAKLLRRTTLSAVISAAKMVADRLETLTALEALLFDTDLRKHLKERTQLHKILEDNTWIFGEHFALTLSDQSLTEVLEKHVGRLMNKRRKRKEVKRADGRRGIVDLFLTRRLPLAREEERDYLVVEFKAPTVSIGSEETQQVRSYAYAIQDDERFHGIKARWNFWVISSDVDAHAREKSQAVIVPMACSTGCHMARFGCGPGQSC